MVDFFVLEYFHILDTGGFNLYRYGTRALAHGYNGGSKPIWAGQTQGEYWSTGIITYADIRGSQQTAVFSPSLDEIYASYYNKYDWMQKCRMEDKTFEVEYGPLSIRLLSSDRAVAFVQIKRGNITIIQEGNPLYEQIKLALV